MSSSEPVAPSVNKYLYKAPRDSDPIDIFDDNLVLDQDNDSSSDSSGYSFLKSKKKTKPKKKPMVWSQEELTDDDYMLCPATVMAFVLHEKTWAAHLLFSCLRPIEWKTDPYQYLQLPEEKKNLIRYLVRGFGEDDSLYGFDDIIQGKGKGLIFLLHGPPGLGKTLTAGELHFSVSNKNRC